MRKNKLLFIFCIAFVAASLAYGRFSASAQPGTASDPLVSKNYVDSQIEGLRILIANASSSASGTVSQADKDSIASDVIATVDHYYGALIQRISEQQTAGGHSQFERVFARSGQVLIADSGTEMVLRAGSASAVSGPNGLLNATAGADIVNGNDIPLNHLLIVPASDGRGMMFKEDSWVMVKGVYYFA